MLSLAVSQHGWRAVLFHLMSMLNIPLLEFILPRPRLKKKKIKTRFWLTVTGKGSGICILERIPRACNGNTVGQSAPADRIYSLIKKQTQVDKHFLFDFCVVVPESADLSAYLAARLLFCRSDESRHGGERGVSEVKLKSGSPHRAGEGGGAAK